MNTATARHLALALLGASVAAASAVDALHTYTVPNDLRLTWPADLVSLPAPKDKLPPVEKLALETQGVLRPVQLEEAADGSRRLWSVMTVERSEADAKGRKTAPADIVARLVVTDAWPDDARIALAEEPDAFRIANGLYEFRLRRYAGRLPRPVPLSELPHWIAGMRPAGTATWDGRAAFDGDARVVAAQTEILQRGPVFVEARVRYVFEGAEEPAGTVPALALASGKQTHRWAPFETPLTDHPKHERFYEARIRFVWNDPWIDVNEQYRLPPCPGASAFGIHQYRVEWGKPEANAKEGAYTPLDTVTWVRWFEWDVFGGNVSQLWVPAQPRPAQKGRPFALLRPIWNQGGGGAQDFFLTRGAQDAQDADDAPMFGVVAAFASKWLAPYAQTIAAYAYDGTRGVCRFPLTDGDSGKVWYAQRAYGLCVGPRKSMPSLNNLVRRHTDWTLDAQANRYVLRWPGRAENPSAKAPTAQLYLERRYQDDFLNPTQRMTRDVKNFGKVAPGTCGASHAAMGYIYTDLDHWVGWRFGWAPGNPNFHTDKYMGAIYIASAMPDHPHAQDWLAYGLRNFEEDQKKVFFEPDGVGYECPGYAGYSMNLQLDIAANLIRQKIPNPVAANPLFAKSARWHRKLLTPVDPRLGFRHEAPHGDTHRWTSGLGVGFGKLALLLKDADRAAAAEFRAVGDELARTGGLKREEWQKLLDEGLNAVKPADLKGLDWTSQAFDGFGAVLRHGFGTPTESFVSIKAGHAGGHYHNDDLAPHLYLDGRPVALDYNCSYHPRGDHAALHSSATFGREGTVKHNGRNEEVEAMEQAGGRARRVAFATSEAADVFAAERTADSLTLSPVFPGDAEFSRPYPSRKVSPIRHRRWLMLVKPAKGSKMPAFMVVRDEFDGSEPVQLNLHLLAREILGEGPLFRAPGQWDRDLTVFVAHAPIGKIEKRAWHYHDEWMSGPPAYAILPNETQAGWRSRLESLKRQQNLTSLPPPDWKPTYHRDQKQNTEWFDRIRATQGAALMPPHGWRGPWQYGEIQQWLRLHLDAKAQPLWVLFASPEGEVPAFEASGDGEGVRVTYRGETREVRLGSRCGAVLVEAGKETIVHAALPGIGAVQ